MKRISLEKYSPIVSDKEIGKEIYNSINEALEDGNNVTVDMQGIKSMATFCAKQIFGQLYLNLGASDFFERLVIKNASDDLKVIIKVGIQNAIEDKEVE